MGRSSAHTPAAALPPAVALVRRGARVRAAWWMVAALAAMTLALTAACNEVGGAGTFSVCQQALFTAPDMPVQWDVSSGPTQIHDPGYILLRLTHDCARGVDVSLEPASAALVVSRAKADDGRTVGLVLSPRLHRFRLMIEPPDGAAYSVEIDDSSSPRPTPTG